MSRHLKLIAAGLIVAVVLYGAYTVRQSPQPFPSQPPPISSGDKGFKPPQETAPEISLKDLDGQTVKLSDYQDRIIILVFWSSWSYASLAILPDLNETAKELAQGNDAVLLTVDVPRGRGTATKAEKYIRDHQYTFKVLVDSKGKAANAYSIMNLPTTYIIQKNGKIYAHRVGTLSSAEIIDYVNKLK